MKRDIFLIFILTISFYAYSQTEVISGRVIDQDLEPVPLAFVLINDTTRLASTDMQGYFNLELPDTIHKFVIATVGFEPVHIILNDSCRNVEIILFYSPTHTYRGIDRERLRNLKRMPELYKKAYMKGLFKATKPCYQIEFFYYRKDKKKTFSF